MMIMRYQPFLRLLLAIHLMFGLLLLRVAPILANELTYISGKELCQNHKDKLKKEIPYWVKVPKFYQYPDRGFEEIYAFTHKAIDYNKPTLIFFVGGPGVSAREISFNLPGINILYFDQRGVACSRPSTERDFLNPNYYSSENTARDALRIIQYLRLSKVTVYGHSYGTIPATIFASLFPKHTEKVVLEGVISNANVGFIQSKLKQVNLQNFFNSLELTQQNKIIDLSTSGFVPANWFSRVGSMMLYLDGGLDAYRRFLNVILNSSEDNIKQAIGYFYLESANEDLLSFSQTTLVMLSCQETAVTIENLSPYLLFNEKRELYFEEKNIFFDRNCKPFNLLKPQRSFYNAQNFPVRVPVYYFLGETDGATDVTQGFNHFQNVSKGMRTLFIMNGGGHLPNLGLVKENRPCDPETSRDRCASLRLNKIQTELFRHIVQSNKVNLSLIDDFNKSNPNPWYFTQRFK